MSYSLYTFASRSHELSGIATRILTVLEPWIRKPPRTFTYGWHGKGGTEENAGSILDLGKAQDRIINGHTGCIRLVTILDMRFSFGCEELKIYYDKLEAQQIINIDIATTELLRTRNGEYLRDNLDALCAIGGEIFVAGGFCAGLFLDEEGMTSLELANCATDPPIDFCYWSGEVLGYVPRADIQGVDNLVAECRKMEGGSRYWRWDDYEQGSQRHASEKLSLKAALQMALRDMQTGQGHASGGHASGTG